MSASENVNAVRQILMNELGLTRESVRAMVEQIVTEAMDRHVRRLLAEGWIEKEVQRVIGAAMSGTKWSEIDVRKRIAEVVGAAVQAEFLRAAPQLIVREPS